MKKYLIVFVSILLTQVYAAGLSIKVPAIAQNSSNQKFVFNSFGCSGENVSPEISWKDAPAGTKSFAVTFYDKDAPTGSGFWHWVVVNIPANVTMLPEGASNMKKLPDGAIEVMTDFGTPGYGGACPPVGDKPHRYTYTVYALSTDNLGVPNGATAALAGFFIHSKVLAKASYTYKFSRTK